MDIEKLIRRLRNDADAYRNGETLGRAFADQEDVLDNAATALSTLQAESAQLRGELEYEREHANAYYQECGQWEAENEKLRAELEQVKQERDAAIKEIFQWTGCPACKHWDSADNWCNKHDRSADSCDGCSTPEWRGLHKEE